MDVERILSEVKEGTISIEEAAGRLKELPYEDLGFAKLDHHRKLRTGFGEVVFCQGKKDPFLQQIFEKFYKEDREVLGTRADEHQYEIVKEVIPEIQYDPISRVLFVEQADKKRVGRIAVCTGGTADIPVAEEAARVAEFLGCNVERIYDVGVSGIHRLLSQREKLSSVNCVIAVAGMEGALGTVIAGMVDVPVIAVPTSVGYGASMDGLSALLTMINSCANGISVVNIDNGFGAGYNAALINRLVEKGKDKE